VAAEVGKEAMKAAISILDCSIIRLTLGENLTPEEKSLANLLMSGPFEETLLAPSGARSVFVDISGVRSS
jgi:hypothetical protein